MGALLTARGLPLFSAGSPALRGKGGGGNAPALSNPVDSASGTSAATGSVDTTGSDGTLYWVATASGTAPSKAQVKAGQDHTGTALAAGRRGGQAVSAAGRQVLSPAPSGLAASTPYWLHFMHESAGAKQSSVVSGDGFTTAAPAAPVLSNPLDNPNGSTGATGSVSTTGTDGTLFWVVTNSGTAPSSTQVRAGQSHTGAAAAASGSQAVLSSGLQVLSPEPSGLTAGTAYWLHLMHETPGGVRSAVVSGDGFATAAPAAPVLSNPVDNANGSTAATGSVSTTGTNGTLYWVVTTSATAPSGAQVRAGQSQTGAAAAAAGSQPVTASGVQALSPAPSGLGASTAYWLHFTHETTGGVQSAVASGDGFTTAAATPVLSNPVDNANGSTAAAGSVSTTGTNGTLYWVVTTSATAPSGAQVRAGQSQTGAAAAAAGSQPVTASGVQALSPAPSGLGASTAYWLHFMHEATGGVQSAVASGDGFTTAAPVAPVLSNPVDNASGSAGATGSVSTTVSGGTLFWVVTSSATSPSKAQVKAGQSHTGAAAAASGSQAVTSSGTQALSPAPSGLGAATAYWLHFMHEGQGGAQSAVASGDGFTTAPAASTNSFEMGALTRSGAGGIPAPAGATAITGGTATGYAITGGMVVPSGNASATSGTLIFNNSASTRWDVTAVPKAWSVLDSGGQLAAAANHASLALGDQILMRGGSFNPNRGVLEIKRTSLPTGTWNGSNYVVIKPHTGHTVTFGRLDFNNANGGTKYFSLENVTFTSPSDGVIATSQALIRFTNGANTCRLKNITGGFTGHNSNLAQSGKVGSFISPYLGAGADNVYEDITIDGCYDGFNGLTGARHIVRNVTIKNCYNDGIKMRSDCRGCLIEGVFITDKKQAYTTRTITSVTRGNPTVIGLSSTSGLATGHDIKLVGITGLNSILNKTLNINAINSTALTVTVGANTSGDAPWTPGSGEAQTTSTHGDGIQGSFASATVGQLDNMTFRAIVITHGDSTPHWKPGQGVFISDNTVDINNLRIEGLIYGGPHQNGVVIKRAKNSKVIGVVCCHPLNFNSPGFDGNPRIEFNSQQGGNFLYDSVYNNISATGVTVVNCRQVTKNDSAAYADLFVNAQNQQSQVVGWQNWASRPGGSLDTANPKIGATPYVRFTAPFTYSGSR